MADKFSFENSVVVVLGAAGGIGESIAEHFAEQGADVVIGDVDTDGGIAATQALSKEYDGRFEFQEMDISDFDACKAAFNEIVDTFGRVDIMVNTAAAMRTPRGKPFLEEDPADWEPQFDITLRGPIYATKAVLPHMVEQEHGSIVLVLSDSYQGQDPNLTIYGSAKGGLATFTKSLAREVGKHGIRVNAVSPGTTKVERNEEFIEKYRDRMVESYPLGRLGRPDDHANAVLFLASDEADWVTGQILSVNGGYL